MPPAKAHVPHRAALAATADPHFGFDFGKPRFICWEMKFGNYDELPLTKAQMRQRLSDLLGRSVWEGGAPFSSEIQLQERKVSRKPPCFEDDLGAAFREIVAEVKERSIPSDYLFEVIFNDEPDNNENPYRDWLFIRVRLVRR